MSTFVTLNARTALVRASSVYRAVYVCIHVYVFMHIP